MCQLSRWPATSASVLFVWTRGTWCSKTRLWTTIGLSAFRRIPTETLDQPALYSWMVWPDLTWSSSSNPSPKVSDKCMGSHYLVSNAASGRKVRFVFLSVQYEFSTKRRTCQSPVITRYITYVWDMVYNLKIFLLSRTDRVKRKNIHWKVLWVPQSQTAVKCPKLVKKSCSL